MKHYSILFLIAALAAGAFAYSGVISEAGAIGKGLALFFMIVYLICVAIRVRNKQNS